MVYYSTSEAAKLLNISKVTLTNWRKRGIIRPAVTTPTGRQFYSEAQVTDLRNEMGFGPIDEAIAQD